MLAYPAWLYTHLCLYFIHSNFFSQEICNQHHYRKQRKQQLLRLQETAFNLQRKASYLSEKMEYYERYVKACLGSLTRASVRWVIQHTNYVEFLSLYNNITFQCFHDPNAPKKNHDSTKSESQHHQRVSLQLASTSRWFWHEMSFYSEQCMLSFFQVQCNLKTTLSN